MSVIVQIPSSDATPRLAAAETVFEQLQQRILSLELPPGTRLTEAEVGRQMGVSRQPVRDAFYRLSKLGFLTIRPQRATIVSRISAADVLKARFIRAALELEIIRTAADVLSEDDVLAIETLVKRQKEAIDGSDPANFHKLDDEFHKEIARRAGLGFAWDIIRENKAHMDRVRYLSLSFNSGTTISEHLAIVGALRARDREGAAELMRYHLSRILELIEQIRSENHDWFESE